MPWVDEFRKDTIYDSSTITRYNQNNGTYSIKTITVISNTYNQPGTEKSRVLSYKKDDNGLYNIDSNKNYMFKHNISQVTPYLSATPNEPRTLKLSHFLNDDIYFFYTNASGISTDDRSYNYFQYEMDILSTKDNTSTNNYYDYYSYYNSLNNKEVERSISYDLWRIYATIGSKANAYIVDFEITELDFFINGFKKNISDPADPDSKFKDSAGWYYNKDNNSYGFKRESNADETPYYEIGYLNKVNKINDVKKLGNLGDGTSYGRAYFDHYDEVDYKVGDLIKIFDFDANSTDDDDWGSGIEVTDDGGEEHRVVEIIPPYDSYTDPSGNIIPPNTEQQIVIANKTDETTTGSGKTQFIFETICDENFIATKINSDTFNAEFKFHNRDSSDTYGNELSAYLIPSNDFERWRNREVRYKFNLSDYTSLGTFIQSTGTRTLNDNVGKDKYLLFHLKDGDENLSKDVVFSEFKITGEYTDDTENNVLKDSIPAILATSDVSFTYGDSNSFIGNGKFLSGVWENGVWNNGSRKDSDSFQFDDVLNSYPISDGKWRIEIGRSVLLSTNEKNLVGEYISIGNIVVININEERKFLKKSYLVVDVIDNYIVIEAEFSFPVRRIEKDSNKHRIKVSKNVWLSGTFLSGTFEGIWNDGVFKGNPSNNVMENTQWIDGTFDGGRFKSNYNITGNFYNLSGESVVVGVSPFNTVGVVSNEINNILYAKLSVNNLSISPLVGDILNITNSKNYSGDSKVLEVEQIGSVYNITIDKEYLTEDEIDIYSSTHFGITSNSYSSTNTDLNVKLEIEYLTPTNFTIGQSVNISKVSNPTVTDLGLDPDIETTGGKTYDVLEIRDAVPEITGVSAVTAVVEVTAQKEKIKVTVDDTGGGVASYTIDGSPITYTTTVKEKIKVTVDAATTGGASYIIDGQTITSTATTAADCALELFTLTNNNTSIDISATQDAGGVDEYLYLESNTPGEPITYLDVQDTTKSTVTSLETAADFASGLALASSTSVTGVNVTHNSVDDFLYLESDTAGTPLPIISGGTNTTKSTENPNVEYVAPVTGVTGVSYSRAFGQRIIFDSPVSTPAAPIAEVDSKSKSKIGTLENSNLKLIVSTGLVQNFTFNDNNLSKSTSNNSISSTTVFRYNSWIDVNYDVNEAVNIGRDTKVTDSITGVNTSNNNLYGYPTSDVLSSKSKFRSSNTLNSKIYNLGTKFKKYTDFLGDSSLFEDPFNTTNNNGPFEKAGWSITIDSDGAGIPNPFKGLELERTSPSLITEGKELKINSRKNGGIFNNEKITLEKSRYSIIEFDLIDLPSSNKGTTYISSKNNVYPILSFSNLNYETRANFDDSTDLLYEQPINYLPTYQNVNLLNTPNSKKVEYFFNKKDLMMDIKGYGYDHTIPGITDEFEVIIDNLKIYEVDMIPFFKYFNESNINKSIQTPLVGTSPFIEYTLNSSPFIESQSIPFDSIDIKTKE